MIRRRPRREAVKPSGPAAALYARLRALGCTYCPRCVAFMYPDHQHVRFQSGRVYEAPAAVVEFTAELEAVA